MRCAFVRLFFWVLFLVPLTYVPAVITRVIDGQTLYENTRLFFICLGANSMDSAVAEITRINWAGYLIQIVLFIVVFQLIIDALTVMCAYRKGYSCHTQESKIKKSKKK